MELEDTSYPLFVLSGPRSGSTLLRYILDTHSQIASPAALILGSLCTQLEWVIRLTKGEAAQLPSPRERQEMVMAETREAVDRIMSSYLAVKGKRIWCDKSILNLKYLPILTSVFPDARFICLYRDSLDTVHSCLEYSRNGFMPELSEYVVRQPHNLIAAMLTAWTENTTTLVDFEAQNPDRCFRIRYEDLVTTPEESLRPLFAFAGVAWEEDLLPSVFTTRHDQRGGDMKILATSRIDPSRVGVGQSIPLGRIPETIRLAADRLSEALSYPPIAAGRRLSWQDLLERRAAPPEDASASPKSFETFLQQRLRTRAEQAATIQGSCSFVLQGQGGGTYKVDFTQNPPVLLPDEGKGDCNLTISVASFEEMTAGRLNPILAWREGKVKVEGNLAVAEKVVKLIF